MNGFFDMFPKKQEVVSCSLPNGSISLSPKLSLPIRTILNNLYHWATHFH